LTAFSEHRLIPPLLDSVNWNASALQA